jgi:hypothetical protein
MNYIPQWAINAIEFVYPINPIFCRVRNGGTVECWFNVRNIINISRVTINPTGTINEWYTA